MSSPAPNSPAPNAENGPATEVDRHQLQPVEDHDSTRISVDELVDDQPSAPSPGNGGDQVQPVMVRDSTTISVEEISYFLLHEFNNRIINRSAVEKAILRTLRSDLSRSISESRLSLVAAGKLKIRRAHFALTNIALAERGLEIVAHLEQLIDRRDNPSTKLSDRLVTVDEQQQPVVVPPSNPFLLSDQELMGLSIREFHRGMRMANMGDEQNKALMKYRRELKNNESAKRYREQIEQEVVNQQTQQGEE